MIEIYVGNASVLNDTCVSENNEMEDSVLNTFWKCILAEQQLYSERIKFI